jgi:hypothetical protein
MIKDRIDGIQLGLRGSARKRGWLVCNAYESKRSIALAGGLARFRDRGRGKWIQIDYHLGGREALLIHGGGTQDTILRIRTI